MSKLLTVSIAAYNVENFLKNTLDSCVICEKLLEDIEVIIVNDGSKDRTSEIANIYVKKYPNTFKLIDKENGGYGSTVNASLQYATGKYFKLLDGDDWFNTKELEKFVGILDQINDDLIISDYSTINDITRENILFHSEYLLPDKSTCTDQLPADSDIYVMHRLTYKTSILREAGLKLPEHCFYTDTQYITCPLWKIETYRYIPFNIYQYRIGQADQSISLASIIRHLDDIRRMLEDLEYYFDAIDYKRREWVIDWRISESYKFYISYLFFEKDSKQEIYEFINRIYLKYPQRYKLMKNRKIRLMNITKGKAYALCKLFIKLGL